MLICRFLSSPVLNTSCMFIKVAKSLYGSERLCYLLLLYYKKILYQKWRDFNNKERCIRGDILFCFYLKYL